MDYANQNEILRNYYKKDFSKINELILKIRKALIDGSKITLEGLDLSDVVDFNIEEKSFFYISIFQEFCEKIRFGSRRKNLEETLNRIVEVLRTHKRFNDFDIKNPDKTRILIEWITKRHKVNPHKLHTDGDFDENRFEPGITGIEAVLKDKSYVWLPTDSPVMNEMTLLPALAYIGDKMGITNGKGLNVRDKAAIVRKLEDAEFYSIESKAFVSYQNEVIPLYRGNVLYKEFDYNTVIDIFKSSIGYLIANMNEDGQFMYYYNSTLDNNIDHEHPKCKPPKLYYNDLRHCGGTICLLRMFELTRDEKYLEHARKALDWSVKMTRFHKDKKDREGAYVFANSKAKLGGVGLPLIAFMRYRMDTNDKRYDRYIEGYVRHILSRMTEDGEFMGYYIHPLYHNGEPLDTMTDEERNATFSFYYPGEALLGLAMYANHFKDNKELADEVIKQSKIAMKWIIEQRPKLYAQHFTALPSDAWLMQAIEEWAHCKGFLEKNAIDFVFNDAKTMMEKTYKKDDSPYIDFEGGMYYDHGNHYFPDGARCEGLIAAHYLAKHLELEELAKEILDAAKMAAKCQFQLYISKYNNFAHRNPKKSECGIKFKSTRQWTRVDSVQHVACFFIRLYWAENLTNRINIIK